MKILIIASTFALSFGGAVAPAFAEPARAASGVVAATSKSAAATSGSRDQAGTRRYCIVDTITGSRVPVKQCRTRADWLKDGFDPLDPK